MEKQFTQKIFQGLIEFKRGSIVDSKLETGVVELNDKYMVVYPKADLSLCEYNHVAGNISDSDIDLTLPNGTTKDLKHSYTFDDEDLAFMYFNK